MKDNKLKGSLKQNSKTNSPNKNKKKKEAFIPQAVANRMARRVALTTGLPTICGMSVFIISYLLITKGIAEVSPSLTLTISALFFFLGLAGLSYGILSASWDNSPGTLLGLENIQPNIQRMRTAFKSTSNASSKEINSRKT